MGLTSQCHILKRSQDMKKSQLTNKHILPWVSQVGATSLNIDMKSQLANMHCIHAAFVGPSISLS